MKRSSEMGPIIQNNDQSFDGKFNLQMGCHPSQDARKHGKFFKQDVGKDERV